MSRWCQMVTMFLALPKLMIMPGFLHLEMSECWCKRTQFLRKQSLLSVAYTSHIWDFRPNILQGGGVPKAERNFLIFDAEYSKRNSVLWYTVCITYNEQIVLESCVKTILWSLLNNNQNLQSELIPHLFTKFMH